METSILTSTKKILGLDESYTAFDLDVTTHINSVFATLVQLGIGPANGFMIQDKDAVWTDFLGQDLNLNSIKTYVYLKLRLAFDPPPTPYHIQALEKQIEELEWRLNTQRESTHWTEPITDLPIPDDPWGDGVILDGGTG